MYMQYLFACGPSAWGMGKGITTFTVRKKQFVTKYYTGP